ncbi:MAG TPA: hypothetical protein VKF38_10650 [Anaerolineaceae bacterium]|nr:hypothetical protein [Anaerolineaceae bacterium]
MDEKDPQAVKRFLEPLVQRLGVSVIVTDDMFSYKQVAEDLQLEQQICQFHVRRWVGLAIHELKESLPPEWIGIAEEVRQILRDLPIEGDKRLVELCHQFPAGPWRRAGAELTTVDKLRSLIVRLAQNWAQYRVIDWQPDVPWTNNPTEQVVGKMKMRARTVRGYKTWPGMASGNSCWHEGGIAHKVCFWEASRLYHFLHFANHFWDRHLFYYCLTSAYCDATINLNHCANVFFILIPEKTDNNHAHQEVLKRSSGYKCDHSGRR